MSRRKTLNGMRPLSTLELTLDLLVPVTGLAVKIISEMSYHVLSV